MDGGRTLSPCVLCGRIVRPGLGFVACDHEAIAVARVHGNVTGAVAIATRAPGCSDRPMGGRFSSSSGNGGWAGVMPGNWSRSQSRKTNLLVQARENKQDGFAGRKAGRAAAVGAALGKWSISLATPQRISSSGQKRRTSGPYGSGGKSDRSERSPPTG